MCSRVYKFSGSTSAMLNHLRVDHTVGLRRTENLAGEPDSSADASVLQGEPESDGHSAETDGTVRADSEELRYEEQQVTGTSSGLALNAEGGVAQRRRPNTQNRKRLKNLLSFMIKTDQAVSLLDNAHFKTFVSLGELTSQMPFCRFLKFLFLFFRWLL